MAQRGIHQSSSRMGACLASLAMIAALTVATPAAATALEPLAPTTPNPDLVDCAQLTLGEACTIDYADHEDRATNILIPDTLSEITVILTAGAGGGGDGQAGGGQGGSVVATIPLPASSDSTVPRFTVWLGQQGIGEDHGSKGYASGGEGGFGLLGHDGAAGGGASGLAWYSPSGADKSTPLLVAGGGGGGGHNSPLSNHDAGQGGAGGHPAQAGEDGTGNGINGVGGKGGGASHPDGESSNGTSPVATAGGGGGGGGFPHGGANGDPGEIFPPLKMTPAPGGGGGGGDSYADSAQSDLVAYSLGAWGDGKLTIFAGTPQRFDCISSWAPRTLAVPDDVVGYGFIVTSGSGTNGSNSLSDQGHGAMVSGMLNVEGVTSLDYWVGCDGYVHDGAGYGHRGGGASAPPGANDGGDGGGASMIAITSPFTPLIAAGGGGGTGGDLGNCSDIEPGNCGGQGGSGGGVNGTRFPANGEKSAGGGADGGIANSHTSHGHRSPDGGPGTGTSDGLFVAGGGGGGGAGYPSGGGGGSHETYGAGSGGGAGGSYLSSQRVTNGSISPRADAGSGYILLLPMKQSSTTLTVAKAITGDAASFAHGPFAIDVLCTLGGANTLSETISLAPGGSHTFAKVVSGSACTVTETNAGGATTPAPPRSLLIGTAPTTITLSNDFATTSLDVTVASVIRAENGEPNPGVALTLGELGIHLACTFNGAPVTLPAPVSGGELGFTGENTWASDGETITVDGLPVGAECTAVQSAGSGASAITYSVDGATSSVTEASFSLGGTPTKLRVDDVYQLAPLALVKGADGDSAPPSGASYSGSIGCTFQGRAATLPASAAFTLAVGATTTVHNLPIGARCTVTETDPGTAVTTVYSPAQTLAITADPVPTVTITNTFDSGTLLVSLQTSGAGAEWANIVPQALVRCQLGPDVVLNSTVIASSVAGGWRSFPVDGGAQCTIVQSSETGASNVWFASSTQPVPSSTAVVVEVPSNGTATLSVDNNFTAAPLRVTTTTTGDGAIYASHPTTVTVSDCTFNNLPIDITPGVASLDFTLPAHGGSVQIPELVTGANCAVSGKDMAGATATTAHASNGDPAAALSGPGMTVTVNEPDAAGEPTTLSFDNRFDLAALTVATTVAGEAAWAANTNTAVAVQCTFLDVPVSRLGPNGTAQLLFAPDGQILDNQGAQALATLSVGAVCHAVEQLNGGATSVDYSPAGAAGEPGSGLLSIPEEGTAIAVVNIFAATSLTTSVTLAGNDAANHLDDEFYFSAACTFNDKLLSTPPTTPPPSEVYTLRGGDSYTVAALPVGAVCGVNQFEDQHATQVTPSHDQTVTLTPAPSLVAFTNTFEVTPLTVNEVLLGEGAASYGESRTFLAELSCIYPGADRVPVQLADAGELVLSAANDFAVTLSAPVGVECTVDQPLDMATHRTLPSPVTLHAGEHHALPITSEYLLGEIVVSKTAHGMFKATQKFAFQTSCVWPWGENGAVSIPLNGDDPAAFKLQSGDTRTFEALLGAVCTVTESDSAGAVRVVVDAQGTDASTTGSSATVTLASDVANTVAFTNFMPGALPVTGTNLGLILVPALFLLLGGLVLILARRRHS